MTTLTEQDIRRLELHERLEKALELLAGDQGFPESDPVADSEAAVAALSDQELVWRMYELVGYVADPLCDRFYRLLDEAFERFCLEAVVADDERRRFEEYGEGSEQALTQLEGDRQGRERRAALRKAAHDA